jgi:hypothetical protein
MTWAIAPIHNCLAPRFLPPTPTGKNILGQTGGRPTAGRSAAAACPGGMRRPSRRTARSGRLAGRAGRDEGARSKRFTQRRGGPRSEVGRDGRGNPSSHRPLRVPTAGATGRSFLRKELRIVEERREIEDLLARVP